MKWIFLSTFIAAFALSAAGQNFAAHNDLMALGAPVARGTFAARGAVVAPDAFTAQARALVARMTIEEKASLCSGQDFWSTRPIERLGLPSIYMTDGPHGLRKDSSGGFGHTIPATCFPTASALASSWNPGLAYQEGVALGEECQANNVQIILGPGVNMKRSPLGGRNFEYFSEDPRLAGAMAAALIRGEQSQGVGSSLKHFAANNQETDRFTMSSDIDERTLHELYLPAFERAVTEAQPATVMCAYNKLNGTYCSQNQALLTGILRDTWGYKGFVVSDWGAVDDRVAGIKAGLNLEMPGGSDVNTQKIVAAVKEGRLRIATLDSLVTTVVATTLRLHAAHRDGATYDANAHHAVARAVDDECIVLLKNEDGLLPVTGDKTVAVIGAFAKTPRYQGGGSSQINPTRLADVWGALGKEKNLHLLYAQGYLPDGSTNDTLLAAASAAAASADVVLVFTGLPESYESEGYDRSSIDLPEGHNRLIASLPASKTVVVLMNGSAVAMPWAGQVKGIVEGWLGGQAGGDALADVLTGRVNPSGKLSETFPVRLEDTPPYPLFPARDRHAVYGEGNFTGYRFYDARRIAPLFPFGFGLSYTHFTYKNIFADRDHIRDTDSVGIAVTLRNDGNREGKEVVELYVHETAAPLVRPERELRHFAKVDLQPGEETIVHFRLGYRDFAYYDPAVHDWQVHTDVFDILAGGSSRDLPLRQSLQVEATRIKYPPITRYSSLKELKQNPRGASLYPQLVTGFARSFGAPGPEDTSAAAVQARQRAVGAVENLLGDTPLCKFINFSRGKFSEADLQRILQAANRP
ncbi:glycoside hydrolase family 3 C-terminal domain-containing protein [Dinghuibacter silviterrae]|uniref:Beta-glucosidase n=1 Tax=Dinghuibacter silviterrae TaxID=1539049 RepID=A0A4R8DVV1_9BACT|nr:glycoside hydrolase family 3 C-terminal domain-containing protein [Dinghuibacter silviterrae]TDX01605.1 beta-glucosidase [Dinghuibacter silviterrae]